MKFRHQPLSPFFGDAILFSEPKSLEDFQTQARLWLDEANQIRNTKRVKTTAFGRMDMCTRAARFFKLELVARSARFDYENYEATDT
jgi:hypothetical protein